MGSKQSQNNNKEEKISENAYNINNKYNSEIDDNSLNNQTKENTDNSSITTVTDVLDNHMGHVLYKFEWKGEGDKVQICGDFLENWKLKVYMNKNEKNGFYEVILPLDKKKHQFKFVIDNNWICSTQYPTEFDTHNNKNNIINLKNYSTPINLIKEYNEQKKKELINKKLNKININEERPSTQPSSKIEETRKKTYNCKYPSINDLNTFAPIIMWHYKPIFNLDYQSNQVSIISRVNKNDEDDIKSNKEKDEPFLPFLYTEKNFNTENNTYKKIMTWPHEKLMHFCSNLEDIENDYKHFFRIATTNRNKHKFLTIIYYKPK